MLSTELPSGKMHLINDDSYHDSLVSLSGRNMFLMHSISVRDTILSSDAERAC